MPDLNARMNASSISCRISFTFAEDGDAGIRIQIDVDLHSVAVHMPRQNFCSRDLSILSTGLHLSPSYFTSA